MIFRAGGELKVLDNLHMKYSLVALTMKTVKIQRITSLHNLFLRKDLS